MNYNLFRRKTKPVRVGSMLIGGNSAVSIQSMTNTDTHDVLASFNQIKALEAVGCDIVRLAVPDLEAAKSFSELKRRGVRVPLVADIHFDYKIALAAIEAGADKIRINPGNIGDKNKIREVVTAARERGIPIRIGVNSGSLEKSILKKHGAPTAEALAESALYHANLLEKLDFHDIVISVKASDTLSMIRANRILAEKTDYPLHLGVTEAGFGLKAVAKSSIGIGALLSEGIGDTVRVSLTDEPCEEIRAAREILSAVGTLSSKGMDVVSCPTCGRTKINLIKICREFEEAAAKEGLLDKPLKVALMGCAVNGPGEAREADIGVAGGNGEGLIFKNGEIIRKIREDELVQELIREIKLM